MTSRESPQRRQIHLAIDSNDAGDWRLVAECDDEADGEAGDDEDAPNSDPPSFAGDFLVASVPCTPFQQPTASGVPTDPAKLCTSWLTDDP